MEDAFERYLAVKRILGGLDRSGHRIHPAVGDRGVVSLAQGNGMRRPHPSVVLACVAAVLQTTGGSLETYWSHERSAELDCEIGRWFNRLGIPGHVTEAICIESGATRLLADFLHVSTNPGDQVLVGRAFYHGFASLGEACRIRLKPIETCAADGHLVTADNLTAAIAANPEARTLILTVPTFTGEVYTPAQLSALARVIAEYGIAVFCDMTFACTEHDGCFDRLALASFAGMDRLVVTAMSGSKAFGLANLRIGWACGPTNVIREMNTIATATGLAVPTVAKQAALAALRAPVEYLRQNAQEASARKLLVLECLERVNGQFAASGSKRRIAVPRLPSAGHSVLVSFQDFYGLETRFGQIGTSLDLTRFLLESGGVAISPCYSGGLDDLTARISFGDVGADGTHAASAVCEREIVAAWLQGRTMPESHAEWPIPAQPGFEAGRRFLVDAIVERIGPALVTLAAGQRPSPIGLPRSFHEEWRAFAVPGHGSLMRRAAN